MANAWALAALSPRARHRAGMLAANLPKLRLGPTPVYGVHADQVKSS